MSSYFIEIIPLRVLNMTIPGILYPPGYKTSAKPDKFDIIIFLCYSFSSFFLIGKRSKLKNFLLVSSVGMVM